MNPIRIQRKRSKGWKNPANTVFVGRPTKWGNPFKVDYNVGMLWFRVFDKPDLFQFFTRDRPVETKSEAVYLFEKYGVQNMPDLEELRGKNLSCWCKIGEPCHADILLRRANQK